MGQNGHQGTYGECHIIMFSGNARAAVIPIHVVDKTFKIFMAKSVGMI